MRKLVYAFAIAAISGVTSFAASSSAAPVMGGLALGSTVPLVDGSGFVQKVHGWHCRAKRGWYHHRKRWHRHHRACRDYYDDDDYYGRDYSYYRHRYHRPRHYPYGYGYGQPFIGFSFGGNGWDDD